MVDERLTDGKRIAQLLASEIDGHGGRLAALSVDDARPDVEPTTEGAFAYAVVRGKRREDDESSENGEPTEVEPRARESTRVAEVYVHPDRARVEFLVRVDAAAGAASEAGLRVRPKAVRPPRTLVFVEDGAEVKRVLGAFEAAGLGSKSDGA